MNESMLEELGGPAALASAVDDLYRRLVADPEIAPYFVGVDVRQIRGHMTDFLVAALDGPDQFAGRDLADAHAHLGVTDEAFNLTASHLLDALEHRQVRPELLDSVLERIAPFRSVVVGPG